MDAVISYFSITSPRTRTFPRCDPEQPLVYEPDHQHVVWPPLVAAEQRPDRSSAGLRACAALQSTRCLLSSTAARVANLVPDSRLGCNGHASRQHHRAARLVSAGGRNVAARASAGRRGALVATTPPALCRSARRNALQRPATPVAPPLRCACAGARCLRRSSGRGGDLREGPPRAPLRPRQRVPRAAGARHHAMRARRAPLPPLGRSSGAPAPEVPPRRSHRSTKTRCDP
jgi:hypothetical protein